MSPSLTNTQTLSQVHFVFAASQALFHHNRLVAICLIHFVIISKCHWLRSRAKPLCQSFPLYTAQFKACQCRGKFHIIITRPFFQRCYECLWEGEKERKDWQERCNYFWRSLYYTWKDAVSEASRELHTGNRFVFPDEFFTAPLCLWGNQATQRHTTTVSMRDDVNAPVHMHMSHSYSRLVGLNCDDSPERHDHKCFIIKKRGNKKQ